MKNLTRAYVLGIAALVTTGCGTQPSSRQQDPGGVPDGQVLQRTAGAASEMPAQQTIDLGGGVNLEMVLIPAGSFVMGSNDGLDDEKPARGVTISRPFYLGKYEVTVEQFRRFVEETSYVTDAEKGTGFDGAFGWNANTMEFAMNEEYSWRTPGFPQSDNHPVVNVSWHDATEFCAWLSQVDRKTYRLPTEAEWEYACRAGTTTSYVHGDDAEGSATVGNVADAAFESRYPELKGVITASDGHAYTAPVGAYSPNPFGLYDMHGNVWEWCDDWYEPEYYASSPRRDPKGPATGEERAYRGGGWFNCTRGCRSASRSAGLPENRNLTLGFRVAATLE
ncbi:MAG: formylglycine-generating enzyme family protein [Planctomycetes bacterium]|nr:formylglycine-generating enzyme family protein [Planctomycetota bacterium]